MPTRLRVWLMSSAGLTSSDLLAERLKPFLQRNPQISLELRMIPWSRGWTEILHAYKHGDLPDVVQAGSTWIGTLAHLRLASTVPKGLQTRAAITPWVQSLAFHNGEQIAVPWIVECSLLAVRTDLMEEARLGPHDLADWERFHESCRRLARESLRPGRTTGAALPLMLHSRPEYNTLHWAVPWLWSGGWRPFDPSSSPFRYLSHPSALPGFTYMSKLFQTSPTMREMADAPASRIYSDFFREGRYAMYLGPSDTILRAKARSADGNGPLWPLTILPIPAGPNGSQTRAGGSLLCVPRDSKNAAAAWELVKYLTDDPFLSQRAAAGGEFPALECEYWQVKRDDEQRTLLWEILATATTYPQHPLWRTMEHTLMQGVSEIFWRFIQGRTYDGESQEIAARTDRRLANLIRLGWDIPA